MGHLPNRALLNDITAAAQARIKTSSFADAEFSKREIETIGGQIALTHGGLIASAPLKSEARASEKVALDYSGDWHQLKDVARMTIVAPNASACLSILDDIKRRFTASNGLGVIQIKDVQAAVDPCGYSSITVFVRTSNGRAAEIQINTLDIIYGKQSESSVTRIVGIERYMGLRARFRLEGGMGHHLYEIYRVAPGTPKAQRAANLSKRYYEYFRKGMYNQVQCNIIRGELRDLGLIKTPGEFI